MTEKFFHLFWMYDYDEATVFPRFPAFVQEKYDGVRAIYDPIENGFWFRADVDKQGRFVQLPEGFVTSDYYLDGEIASREYPGDFKFVSGTVRRKEPQFEFWSSHLRFIVFDVADPDLREKPYRERLEIATSAASTAGPFVEPIEILGENVTSIPEITVLRDLVVNRGGEGVISRYSEGEYTLGRSREDHKFKRVYVVKAIVKGYIQSKTKRFAIGSLRVDIPELGIKDQRIGSGLTNMQRRTEETIRRAYPVNSEIYVSYMERTDAGKLREPRITKDN